MSIALIWLTHWELSKRVYAIATTSAVAGATLCGLIWVSDPLLVVILVILMVIIGAGTGALTPIAWGVMQEITPRYMVGRVLSLHRRCNGRRRRRHDDIRMDYRGVWRTDEHNWHWTYAVRYLPHRCRIEPVV